MKKKISTAIFAAAICLYGCYIGGSNEFTKTYAIENEPIPIPLPTEPLPTEQIVYVEPGCYIKIVSEPDRVIYNIGDKLDLTGLKLDVMYASGGAKPVSQINNDWHKVINSANPLENDCFIVDTSDFDSSKPGEYNITISLTEETQLKLWLCGPINIPVTVTDDGLFIKGDVNADGLFNVADVVMLQKWISGAGDLICRQNADLNEDGKINVFDCIMLKRKVMENMQSDKVIDYSVLEQQWVHGSSRANTMTEQAYLAKSLNEFKGIIEKYELCENGSKCSCGYHDVENCIPEKIDEEFFKDKAAIVIYSSRGSGDRFIAVDKIERKQNCLTVYTTTKTSTTSTPDMAYQRLILAVDRDMLQDVNDFLYENTSSVYDGLNVDEYKEICKWYSEWFNSK